MNNASDKVSVLVVDDNVELCDRLARLFEHDGRITVLATLHSPDGVADLVSSLQPDVLLLDLNLDNRLSGLDVLRDVRQKSDFHGKVLVYTVYATDEVIFEALSAGANSYVWKNETTESICQAIVDTFDGKAYVSAGIAHLVLRFFEGHRELVNDNT